MLPKGALLIFEVYFPVCPKQSLLGDFQTTFHGLMITLRTVHLKAYL